MRIPQDETKVVTSADATVAMRLDTTSNTGARKFRVLNRTGQDLYIWITDNVNVVDDNTITNLITKTNAIMILPNNEAMEEDVDSDIKIFGSVASSTGNVRVQEKTN